MADVTTSIGSNSSITTGTPSSSSGSSSPYTVAFPSAPSGVSIGDSVSFQDETSSYATFTYLVTNISGSSLTLKFLTESSGYSGDTSPSDIYDSSYGQASGTFKRTYSTITAWELDLDNTAIYSSGDDAIGECYKDSNFNEAFTINGGGTVGLDSVKLTAPAGQRHDGTAGSGVVNVYNSGTQSTSVISRQNTTISFLEYHMGSNSVNNRACTVESTAYTNIIFSQNIIHNLTGSFPIAVLFATGNSSSDTRYCHNNLFYDIDDSDDRVKALLVQGSYPLKVWNNTTYLIRTGSGSKNAYSFACNNSSTAMEVKNCLAIMTSSTGSEAFALNYNSDSDYNGSDFSTATGGSNDLTSLSTSVFEDYSASPPEFALASGASPIDAGVDLGTTAGVNIGIGGRDRSSDSAWSMGAFQPIPTGVTVSGITAGLDTAAIMGTVEYGSLSVTPTLAGADTAAIMGTSVLGSQSVTPALAGSDTSAIAGTAILASFSVTPSSANVATAAIGPIFNEVTPADPANADTAAIMGTLVYGSLSTTATLAGADTAAVTGTIAYSSFSVTPSVATANVNAESVTSLLASFSLTPTLAGGKTAAIAPYILIVYPSISHSLYIGGASTYSSNQVMALDNGNIIYKTGDSVFNKTIDTAAKAATTFYRATTYFTAGDIEQKIIVQDGGSVIVKNLP